MEDVFNTPFLNDYMRMVEDSESPRLFHIWAAIGGIAAALGRRCWLPFGPTVIYPNHYILLVGTPASRKSTAANTIKRVLKASTGVRFAPQDTAGQRQGLVIAMMGKDSSKEFLDAVEVGGRDDSMLGLTLSELAEVTNDPVDEMAKFVSVADKHHLMVVAGEFSRFIGQNNLQMLDFLTTMWDGDDYEYQTKTTETVLKNPLLNLVGCTTPTSISLSMPPAAGGQGFLSRMILVYGARKYKLVPRPSVPSLESVQAVEDCLNHVYYQLSGPFSETEAARAYSESLYVCALEITDSRFGYYAERRYTHLLKLAMCLAAGRRSMVIEKDDYYEANRILKATERGMPEALGEFGMNPLAAVKQQILDRVRAGAAIQLSVLQASFHRDARAGEIQEVINDLNRAGQIMIRQDKSGASFVHAVYQRDNIEDSMMQLLAEK